ncbi:MAG: ParA family protein [Prevotellaceae bacterium]|nr:ParA family protein [Prevotellaceae bacterium]
MKKKNYVIAFANHKGGVGKTTTTASVGTVLSQMGYKVLLVDLDAQANLTGSLVANPTAVTSNIAASMRNQSLGLPLYPVNKTLDLVPSGLDLASMDIELASAMAREHILRKLLTPVRDNYDFILLDCPPHLGMMTLNALTAADYVIVPLISEVLPFNGLTMMLNFIDMVRENLNPSLTILGILLTRYEKTKLSTQIEQGLRQRMGNLVFDERIRKNVTVAQAPLEAENIVNYDPKSNGAKDYRTFTEAMVNRLKNLEKE